MILILLQKEGLILRKSRLLKGISGLIATAIMASSMSALAAPSINFKDNGNGTATVTATGTEKLVVAQFDNVGALKNFGISKIVTGKETVNMSYDDRLETVAYSFADWETLRPDNKGTKIGHRTISVVDFDSEKQGAYVMYGQGVAEMDDNYTITGKDGNTENKAMHIKRTVLNATNYNTQIAGLATNTSDVVVYEFDFKVLDPNTTFDANIKTILGNGSSGAWQKIMDVTSNGSASTYNVKLGNNGALKTVNISNWNTVAVAVNYTTLKCDYYFNGAYEGTEGFNSSYNPAIHTPDIVTITGKSNTHQDFVLDNIRVYEGTEPRENIDAYDVYFDTTRDNVTVIDYTNVKNTLNGKYAFHLRSGNAYDGNGNSEILVNKPYEKDDVIYVPVAELCKVWGINTPAVTTDAEGYATVNDLATALGMNVYTPESDINSGLVVLANSFTAPTGTELQKLNDYVFYLRPTKEQVAELYKASDLKGQHPRIMATQADFDRVKALVEAGTNEYINAWAEQLIEFADDRIRGFDDPVWQEYPKYEKYDGLRMDFQRETQNNLTLWGMAYHITGDKKYADYAWKTFEIICDDELFPDWNPGHHLDTCEAMTAVSIGYDWFYNAFTPEQRRFIEEGMYKRGILQSYPAFLSNASAMGGAYTSDNNHGVIDNGAAIVTSLAFMDVYPEECEWMMSAALELMENSIYQWSTGMWYEGPTYWELTMMHTVKFISAMQTALGTDLGYGNLQGLSISAKPQIASHGFWDIYNYGDSGKLRYVVPELIWLGNQYNQPEVAEYVAQQAIGGFRLYPDHEWWKNTWSKGEDTALALLWYDPVKQAAAGSLDMDTVYYDEDLDVLTMRNTWDTDGQVFVGLKARGGVDGHSNLDTGSFIFEADGVRWVEDIGTGSYDDSLGYFEWNSQTGRRWWNFETRAESHSTVVVNPEAKVADHKVALNASDAADLIWDGEVASIDMSKVLHDVTAATRKFKMVDNKQSLVVQDEITLDGTDNTVYWFLMTADREVFTSEEWLVCEIEEVENGFILSYVNTVTDEVVAQARVDYVIETNGTISTVPVAGDYDTNVHALFEDDTYNMIYTEDPILSPDNRRHQLKRLELKITGASGNVKITAKITPLTGVTGTMSSVTDYVNGL